MPGPISSPRLNQWEDARTLLMASNPRHFFASERRWKAIADEWKTVTWIRRVKDVDGRGRVDGEVDWAVRGAFHDLLVQTSALDTPPLEELAERALVDMGHDAQRSIASREAMAVSGHPALRIETWDRLSHRGRKSHLFVLANRRLLCLRTEIGLVDDLAPAFEALAASLAIDPGQGAEGATVGSMGGV